MQARKYFRMTSAGFGAHVAIALLLFLAIVGFAGYKVVTMQRSATPATSTSAATEVPATIETKADLVQTGKALDTTDTELDSDLDDTSLDADLDALL